MEPPPASPDDFTTGDLLTLAVAVYAAVVATGVAVRGWLTDRPRVTLRVVPLLNSDAQGTREMWTVRVVNTGHRPVAVEQVGLLVKAKDWDSYVPNPVDLGDGTPAFPVTLNDGEHVKLHFERDEGLGRVRGAWASDVLGREFEGKYPRRTPRGLLEWARGEWDLRKWRRGE